MKSKVSSEDYEEICQTTSLALHLVDTKQWGRLNEAFTADAVYDGRATKTGLMVNGIDGMTELWSSIAKMAVHYGTDLVVTECDRDNGTAKSMSKWFGTIDSDNLITGFYNDDWGMTSDGWRITRRTSTAVLAPDAPPR
jgi:hypothetical protein